MPKLTIELSQEEYDALVQLATQERRTVAMQAAYTVAERLPEITLPASMIGLTSGTLSGYEGRIYPLPPDVV